MQRDPETGEWPTAMQVWRATYQKADGTWSIPTGEEIMVRPYYFPFGWHLWVSHLLIYILPFELGLGGSGVFFV